MQTQPEATAEVAGPERRGILNAPIGEGRKRRLFSAAKAREITVADLLRRLIDEAIPETETTQG